MYVLFASCAFILKGENAYAYDEFDAEPVARICPDKINWTGNDFHSAELWYADGGRFGECFSVDLKNGSNSVSFFNCENSDVSSCSTTYMIDDMHMLCNVSGKEYDFIFPDEMTAYDCNSSTFFVRADYDTLFNQITSGKFINSSNERDYYIFKTNGKSAEYFGDQLYKGVWSFNNSQSVTVEDSSCDASFHFDLIFDEYGYVSGLMFNGIEYNLAV